MSAPSLVSPLRWVGGLDDGHFELLDQRLLPGQEHWIRYNTDTEVARGIRDMVVRGAPAIGVSAAFGVVLGIRAGRPMDEIVAVLAASRPTAVNLFWALERMQAFGAAGERSLSEWFAEAEAIRQEDLASCVTMGDHGATLMPDGARILTICNTGSLATAGYGTAAGVLRSVHRQGRLERVYACETRPYLQGARLTMWELMQDGLPVSLITDGMPGALMAQGLVDAVIAGADRIAANGDTANKIGTYQLAVLAAHHGIPFYIAAPVSTVDLGTASGEAIPIEQRSVAEVVELAGVSIAPAGAHALHPAFDVTPSSLIDAIITEKGVLRASYLESLRAASQG